MLSHIARAAAWLVVALWLASAAGCGIKGPLKLPPKPEPEKAQERDAPAKRSP
jgi:predicted small lipoprotein YifL